MSYIPPLVCDTPPPIDFEDSHEDDFGDGMFSNYDGSSLPTTPKQLSSINDHDDMPLDIPELPDEQHFPNIAEKEVQTKTSLECTELPSTNSSILHTNHIDCEPPELPSVIIESEVDSNEMPKIEKMEIATHQSDVCLSQPVNEPSKLTNSVQSLDNSSASQSNDNVCRSDSPPSLVFSAESINCDDNQCDDFDEFHQHTDDVECNFPSLKLDSISDTKSQSSDLDETTNMPECEIDEVRDNSATTNASSSRLESEFVKSVDAQSSNVEDVDVTVTNADDSFDDFVEYESSVAQPDKSDFVECKAVTAATTVDECTQSKEASDENVFAADFSQFEVYTENSTKKPDEPISTEQHKSHVSTLEQLPTERVLTSIAVTDDFGDFDNADDDDEFGEFNDFSDFTQSQSLHSPLTANVEELTAKIKPLLDSLFPTSDNESEDGSYDGPVLTNDTTKIIKDFENSKALDHQWTTSVGKSSLVTALGIDSRNILYGGKWNSSMPRFAANLGFSPLEPMKPSSVSGPSSSVTNEIPAAQFDWNSSGLTNPLDASHAHTLLLDLEQLVVVANLDKIKLDSSTCSSTIPATASKPTTNNNTMSSLNNHYIHNCNGDDDDDGGVGYQYNGDFYGNSLPYSCETNIKTLEKNVNHFGLFDQFLDIRVQEILHKTNAAENQSSRTAHDWHSTKAEPTLIAQTVPPTDIMHTTLKNINTTNFIDSVIDSEESTQTSASYVVPGSGSLKETHIFTPSKSPYSIPQSREVSNDKPEPKCPDFDYEKAAAGIIIDENVVKKEYRDVEYDPDKPTASTLSNSDDFSDFQSVPIPITIPSAHKPHQNTLPMDFGILQPTKRNDNITINWPDPGNVATSTDMESFDSFRSIEHIGSGSTSDFAATNEVPKSSSSSFGDFAKPVIGVSPSEIMFETNSTAVEDDFSDFQSVEPIPSHNNVSDVISNYRVPPVSDVIPSNRIEPLSKKTDSDSIITSEFNASNWTDFQSTKVNDAPMQPSVPSTNILQPAPLKPLQILTPQPANPQPNLQPSSIWPESEINPDEIARLEAIFPQAQKQSLQPETKPQNANTSKSQEDDEWSDFVSVPTPAAAQPLPITNIISTNIAKHQQDDDEWSDFVSSTTQPPSMQQWNVSSGPNFTSWNAPPQFDSWQSSTLFQQPQQFASTLPPTANPSLISNQPNKANPNSFFTQKAPSISLIPDLSFVAPKTLVNRSRTNYQSK